MKPIAEAGKPGGKGGLLLSKGNTIKMSSRKAGYQDQTWLDVDLIIRLFADHDPLGNVAEDIWRIWMQFEASWDLSAQSQLGRVFQRVIEELRDLDNLW
jgi:hypothetical protein